MASGEGGTGSGEDPGSPRQAHSGIPFDAVANLRALGEVQRRGLEAANQVISRLLERDGGEPSGERSNELIDVDALNDLFGSWIGAMGSAATGPAATGTPAGSDTATAGEHPHRGPEDHARPGGSAAGPAVEVITSRTSRPARAQAEFWLHNYTDGDLSGVQPCATELVGPDGTTWPDHRITFDPAGPFELPSRSSRGVRACIDLPAEAPAGAYRAIVVAGGLHEQWLVLELEVCDPEPTD